MKSRLGGGANARSSPPPPGSRFICSPLLSRDDTRDTHVVCFVSYHGFNGGGTVAVNRPRTRIRAPWSARLTGGSWTTRPCPRTSVVRAVRRRCNGRKWDEADEIIETVYDITTSVTRVTGANRHVGRVSRHFWARNVKIGRFGLVKTDPGRLVVPNPAIRPYFFIYFIISYSIQ